MADDFDYNSLSDVQKKLIQGKVLGIDTTDNPNLPNTGPANKRLAINDLIGSKIPTLAINKLYDKSDSTEAIATSFFDRFSNVIGNEQGTDQDEFTELQQIDSNIIRAILKLNQKIEDINTVIDEKIDEIRTEMEDNITNITGDINSLNDLVTDLTDRLDLNDAALDALTTQLEDTVTEIENNLAELAARLEAKDTELEDLITGLSSSISGLATTINQISDRIDAQDTDIQNIINDLTTNITTINNKFAELEASYTDLEDQIAEKESELSTIHSQITGLINKDTEIEEKLDELETKIEEKSTILKITKVYEKNFTAYETAVDIATVITEIALENNLDVNTISTLNTNITIQNMDSNNVVLYRFRINNVITSDNTLKKSGIINIPFNSLNWKIEATGKMKFIVNIDILT